MARRYSNTQITLDRKGKRFFNNSIYPEIPVNENDIYVITTGTDRYDTLALQFYQDSSLWWVIASANNSKTDSLAVQQGVQLRIPAKSLDVKGLFSNLNKNR